MERFNAGDEAGNGERRVGNVCFCFERAHDLASREADASNRRIVSFLGAGSDLLCLAVDFHRVRYFGLAWPPIAEKKAIGGKRLDVQARLCRFETFEIEISPLSEIVNHLHRRLE